MFVKLLEWIDKNKLDWRVITSDNINNIDFLRANIEYVDWNIVSSECTNIEFLRENIDKLDWDIVSEYNKNIEFLRENIDKLDWDIISECNKNMEFLSEHANKLDWAFICGWCNDYAFLQEHIDYLDWDELCSYCSNIEFLEEHEECINLSMLCYNTNESAIELIERYLQFLYFRENSTDAEDDLDWDILTRNPSAIELLRDNIDKVNWEHIMHNPNCYELLKDYPECIIWDEIDVTKPSSIDLLRLCIARGDIDLDNIDWDRCFARNPNAIELIRTNQVELDAYIDWDVVCRKSNAADIIIANPNKTSLFNLSMNPKFNEIITAMRTSDDPKVIEYVNANKFQIDMLIKIVKSREVSLSTLCKYSANIEHIRKNIDDVDWYCLSKNPYAMELLKENQDKIDWDCIIKNPSIYTYDFDAIRKTYLVKNLCVAQWFGHPRFLEEYFKEHNGIDAFYEWQLNRYVV